MAPPSSFQDELEFRNFKRYDLMNDTQVFEKYLKYSHEYNEHFTRFQHRQHARHMTKVTPFKSPTRLAAFREDMYLKYNKNIGVLSLTENQKNVKMWNYYANSGKGFCVGMDTHLLFNYMGASGIVNYLPEGLPMIYHDDPPEVERAKQVYFKTIDWKWEEEYRVDVFNINGLSDAQRKVSLPPSYFKQVIFGWDMTEASKAAIKEACRLSGLDVVFFQATLNSNDVKLHEL